MLFKFNHDPLMFIQHMIVCHGCRFILLTHKPNGNLSNLNFSIDLPLQSTGPGRVNGKRRWGSRSASPNAGNSGLRQVAESGPEKTPSTDSEAGSPDAAPNCERPCAASGLRRQVDNSKERERSHGGWDRPGIQKLGISQASQDLS
jgi:hypothetical protein